MLGCFVATINHFIGVCPAMPYHMCGGMVWHGLQPSRKLGCMHNEALFNLVGVPAQILAALWTPQPLCVMLPPSHGNGCLRIDR